MPIVPALGWLMREAIWHQQAKSFCLLDHKVPPPLWVLFGGHLPGYQEDLHTSRPLPYSFSLDHLVAHLLISLFFRPLTKQPSHLLLSISLYGFHKVGDQIHHLKSIGRISPHCCLLESLLSGAENSNVLFWFVSIHEADLSVIKVWLIPSSISWTTGGIAEVSDIRFGSLAHATYCDQPVMADSIIWPPFIL